jgi:hypothetical protein
VTKCIVLVCRILVENIDRRLSLRFVVYLDHSTEKREVKTMRLANKQLRRSAQSWINRVMKRHQPRVGYHSELRDWVQHVILEAEQNKDFEKKEQFLSLLKDLNATQANCTCIRGDF